MERIKISPYARKTAAERGIDPCALAGSGPDGRIIWRDVAAAAEKKQIAAPAAGAVAGLYAHADVSELTSHLAALPEGLLTLPMFMEKAVKKLQPVSVAVRTPGAGIDGFLPALREGEVAVLGFGAPESGVLRLNLIYTPSALPDEAVADFLRRLAAVLENPLSLLL